MPEHAHRIRWLGHPVTIGATVLLLLNDHLGKGWWPGVVTGKVSDFAGLVVAPALLAAGLTLVLPARHDRVLAWTALLTTGVGFAVVKLTTTGAELASAAWSVLAGPSRVLADPSDLVALPALGLAWWAWRRGTARRTPAGAPRQPARRNTRPGWRDTRLEPGESGGATPAGGRIALRRVPVLVALPLALVAVGATSKDDPPEPDPTVGVTERAALWTGLMPETLGEPEAATVSGNAVVVATRQGGVAVFDRQRGTLRWQRTVPAESERWRKIRVARDAVLVFLPGAVQVLDLDTGGLLREVAPVTGATTTWTTLYVTNCEPRCAIRALDIASGRSVWTYSTAAGSGGGGEPAYWAELSVTPGEPTRERRELSAADRLRPLSAPTGRVLLAEQYQGRGRYRTLPLDANTGKALGTSAPLPDGDRFAVGSDRTYLRWRDAEPCQVSVSGHDVRTGSAKWTTEFRLPRRIDPVQLGDCVSAWVPQLDAGALVVTDSDGLPKAIDVDSGQARWTGPEGTEPTVLAGGLVAVRPAWQPEITGYDVQTGDRRWVAELPKSGGGRTKDVDRVVATNTRFVYRTRFDPPSGPFRDLTWVRDARTGQLHWIGGGSNVPLGAGSDWLVTRGRQLPTSYLTSDPSYAEPPPTDPQTNLYHEIRLFALTP